MFVGDALRANDAAFRREAFLLSQCNSGNICALRLRCSVHQLSLIRKVAVLMIPKFWSTIVRLAHLFEILAFRKTFASSMYALICSCFVYIPLATESDMPAESKHWKSKADKLRQNFRTKSKLRRQAFDQILDFLNGNLEMDVVCHYCITNSEGEPCCQSRDDALAKCLKLLLPFWSKGFPVPLLYRFKHYDEALSFLTSGISAHRLLIRTLTNMDLAKAADVKQREYVDMLLGELTLANADDLPTINDDVLEADDSFHAVNSKRKQLVYQEVVKQSFQPSAYLLDEVIKPMDDHINRLLRRSELVNKVTLLGKHDSGWSRLGWRSFGSSMDSSSLEN